MLTIVFVPGFCRSGWRGNGGCSCHWNTDDFAQCSARQNSRISGGSTVPVLCSAWSVKHCSIFWSRGRSYIPLRHCCVKLNFACVSTCCFRNNSFRDRQSMSSWRRNDVPPFQLLVLNKFGSVCSGQTNFCCQRNELTYKFNDQLWSYKIEPRMNSENVIFDSLPRVTCVILLFTYNRVLGAELFSKLVKLIKGMACNSVLMASACK